ncbi:hypothetical protein PENARI_c007G10729 [Penicillium arizonense]|uniref:Uncharacterized protein n=1 Tax=Penicillium arizonense TaxID=1835702 RepID=A0A1F5LKJ8_PENAI|nr:hypothetical protein PENARI_c007G10729 [Penicillium arizonense]OGE53734.1 hypothetical protein PENARI_c007G10729 [Penicillium arizonense]
MRHGFPVAHEIFGISQASNAASYLFVLAFEESFKLQNQTLSQRLLATAEEYLHMVCLKAGGNIRLLIHVIYAESTHSRAINRDKLIELVITAAQYMQSQDDYVDTSTAMIYEKVANGEDLDEGKFSLPVIHMFSQSPKRQLLEAIFTERLRQGTMPMEHKRLR